MDNPTSLFQGTDIKINNSQNNEEEEDIEDQKRRKEEVSYMIYFLVVYTIRLRSSCKIY